jgi:hypothetical protein
MLFWRKNLENGCGYPLPVMPNVLLALNWIKSLGHNPNLGDFVDVGGSGPWVEITPPLP